MNALGRFKPYPTYRDSGVEWLGKIPAHWEIERTRRISRAISGGTPAREELSYWNGGIPWVSPKDMKRRVIDSSEDTITQRAIDKTRLQLVQPPAVLIVVRGMILAHTFPVAITSTPVTINQDMKALVLREGIDTGYMAWLLDGMGPSLIASVVEEAAHGTKAIRMDQWRSVVVPIPRQSEQRAIAAFLDRETARIDELIAKKERLIELLQEKRAALITHAVTKGLDPTVPMKDSGVKWLGAIPAHWEVLRSKVLFALRNERAHPGEMQLTASQQYGVIPQSEFMSREGRRVVQVLTGADILKHVDAKDFVISMRSFQGGIEWSPYAGAISSAYVALKPARNVWHSYFVFLFKSRRYIEALQSTSDLVRDGQALRFENFEQVPLPRVPIAEQKAISALLDRETARLDSLMAGVHAAMDRLRELRIALISAAVTGQIDVRGEVSVV